MVALYYKCWYYFKGNRKPWGVFKRGIKWPKLCFKSLPLEDGRIESFRLLSLHKKYEINYGKTEISLHQRLYKSVQFVQLLSCFWLFVTPWTAAHQASLSITNSQSPSKLMSIESVIPSKRLILCRPFLLLPSIFPSIRDFSNKSVLHIRWPKYWSFSFSFSISPSN